MRQPVYNNYQFIDATVFNDGATELLQSTQEIGQFLHDPGLVSPQDVAFAFNNTLQVSVTTASGFAVLFGDGLVVQGLGTANNTVNNVYSVDFAPLVPSSGAVTAYVIASVATIGFNPYIVVGPPVGHPDYNPAFNPYTAYAENRYTLNIVASTTPPDNLTTFSLGQTTLNAGQTGITSLTYTWQYVNSVLRPTGVVAGSYPVATVNVDANGRILAASQTPNVGFTNQANSWSGNQAVSGSVSATTGFSTPANVTCAAASTAGQALNLGQAFKLLQPTASQSITPTALTTVVEPGILTSAIALTVNPGTVVGQKITIYGSGYYPVTISSSVSSGSPYFLDVTNISFYSWTIGAGFPSQFIELTWDGINWKFVSCGQTVVADAVANNQAVNLSQVASIAPQTNKTSFQAAASQIYSSQNIFTAPSNGVILAISTINTSSSLPAGCVNSLIVNGATITADQFINASSVYGGAGCTNGTVYTVTAQLSTPSSGTFGTGDTSLTATFIFIPIP